MKKVDVWKRLKRKYCLICFGLMVCSFSIAYADTYQTYSVNSIGPYISPSEYGNPSSNFYPLLQFDIPQYLNGKQIIKAELKVTGLDYGNPETATVELVISGESNIIVATNIVLPYNFGQYTNIDVTEAVSRWVGDGYNIYLNQGLLVKREYWYDLPTEQNATSSYWPELTIEYNNRPNTPTPAIMLLLLNGE